MKIGLGLYREQLTADNFAFAAQAGATHVVAHLTSYFKGADPKISSGTQDAGWGDCSEDSLWTFEDMSALVANVRAAGLELAAIENFSPRFWSDILLDGPERDRQIEGLKQLVRDAGRAGVPCIGYNFSLAGVYGWTRGPYARGNAHSVGFGMEPVDQALPLPDGVVWNMRYRQPIAGAAPVSATSDQMWDRLRRFLLELVPVAEAAGVVLAAHPDDPPAEQLRGTARLVNRPEKFDRLMGIVDSPSNGLELCLGTLQEMPGGDIYDHVRRFARSGRIGYIHFRNVKGKVPRYYETFVDDGDIDMAEIVRILRDEDYRGVLIPDHTPAMACAASWHAGKAFALGYMKALVKNADALGPSRSLAAVAAE
ncbi:MAG: mannonate dehydratase [Alphaproteobacteria bacterium]|jgi:mannonate dehydratase|nr:mannonate dehydratase [Alphaproteobacteria bacterium]